MSDWIGQPKDTSKHLGFIYCIIHKDSQKYYVGKKIYWNKIRRKPLKGKKRVRRDLKESSWKNYWGSSNEFLKYVQAEGEDKFVRKVLQVCDNKFDLAFYELIWQLKFNVLNDPNSLNEILNVRLRKKKNRVM